MSTYDRYRNLKYGGVAVLILALLIGGAYFLLRDKESSAAANRTVQTDT